MKNPNQDLIDLIELNRLEELNDNCLLSDDEKKATDNVIQREKRVRMNRLRLKIPIPENGKER